MNQHEHEHEHDKCELYKTEVSGEKYHVRNSEPKVRNAQRSEHLAVPNTSGSEHAHPEASCPRPLVCVQNLPQQSLPRANFRSRTVTGHTLTHSAIKASATRPERRRRPHVRLSPGAGAISIARPAPQPRSGPASRPDPRPSVSYTHLTLPTILRV